MDYEVTIGIEIHLELLTKLKMFSDAGYNFQAKANTNERDRFSLSFQPCQASIKKQSEKLLWYV